MTGFRRLELKQSDYEILLLLQEDPLINYSKLASKLNKPVKTISEWVTKLERLNFLGSVRAILDYKALNLELFDVLVSVNDLESISQIEKLCDEHPYTTYRSRVNGAINGMYIQFQAPKGSRQYFEQLFFELNEVIDIEYEIFNSNEQSSGSTFNLDFWDQENEKWNFDWNIWKEKLIHLEDNPIQPHSSTQTSNTLSDLAIEDIFILSRLTLNAKMKQREIMKSLEQVNLPKFSPQRISEKMRFLKEHYVYEYRLYLDWTVLNLYTTLLFRVKCSSAFTNKVKFLIENRSPPFPGNFRKNNDGFLWYLSLAPSHFSKVASLLWHPDVETFEVNFLDYSHSMTYYLYYKTFNDNSRDWIVNSEFMVQEPINAVKKHFTGLNP